MAPEEVELLVTSMELRRVAEAQVRRRLLATPGGSQVVPIGGDVREHLVELDPSAVVQAGASVEEVVEALEERAPSPPPGFHADAGQEYLVRGLGRPWEVAARRKPGRVSDGEVTVFDATGVALEDAAAAALVYEVVGARALLTSRAFQIS